MSDQNQLPAVSEAMREAVARGLLIAREMIAEKFGTWSPEHGHIFAGREVEAIQAIDDALDLASEIARLTGERDAARNDLDEAVMALEAKVAALAPHGTCACSYDKPEDVCSHHSPALAAAKADLTRMRAETERLARIETPRPISEYHEDMGFVLWWILPVCEPPYSGSPLCDDWPEYHTHFTPLPEIRDEDYRPKRTAQTFRDAPIDEHGYVDMSARAALSNQEQTDA